MVEGEVVDPLGRKLFFDVALRGLLLRRGQARNAAIVAAARPEGQPAENMRDQVDGIGCGCLKWTRVWLQLSQAGPELGRNLRASSEGKVPPRLIKIAFGYITQVNAANSPRDADRMRPARAWDDRGGTIAESRRTR